MSEVVIAVEELSKQYRLGTIGGRTLRADLSRWWARRRGKPDPTLRIGQEEQAKRFGETIWALRDVNLEVRQGEILGIIGRNGAGKSTLLKILSRITAPTSGQVKVKGRIGSLLEVGTGFHPELTGRENVFLNGAILGMTKAEVARKFDEIVDFAGIEQFIDTPVKRYSSGMYVRLAFAVAAHLEPEILVVDEVLAVGDAEFQKRALGKMGDVVHEGRTVLFVSHNLASIQYLCPTCAYLDSGRVASIGETNSVVTQYLDQFTHRTSRRKFANGTLVQEITVRNQQGYPCTSFGIGEPMTIEIRVDSKGQTIVSPTINIGFDTSSGTRVFTIGSQLSTDDLTDLRGEAMVVCQLFPPPLIAGDYRLKVGVGSRGVEDLETIESALVISVAHEDYFGNGRYPKPWQGPILVRSNWKLAQTRH